LGAPFDGLPVDIGIEPVAGRRCNGGRVGVDTEVGHHIARDGAVADDAIDGIEIPTLDGAIQRCEPPGLARPQVMDDTDDRVREMSVRVHERRVGEFVL